MLQCLKPVELEAAIVPYERPCVTIVYDRLLIGEVYAHYIRCLVLPAWWGDGAFDPDVSSDVESESSSSSECPVPEDVEDLDEDVSRRSFSC